MHFMSTPLQLIGDWKQNNFTLGQKDRTHFKKNAQFLHKVFTPTFPQKAQLNLTEQRFQLFKHLFQQNNSWSEIIREYMKGSGASYSTMLTQLLIVEWPILFRQLNFNEFFPSFQIDLSPVKIHNPLHLQKRVIEYRHKQNLCTRFESLIGPTLPLFQASRSEEDFFLCRPLLDCKKVNWSGMPLNFLTWQLIEAKTEEWPKIISKFSPMIEIEVYLHQEAYSLKPFGEIQNITPLLNNKLKDEQKMKVNENEKNKLIHAYAQKNFRLTYHHLQNLIELTQRPFYRLSFLLLQMGHYVTKEDLIVVHQQLTELSSQLSGQHQQVALQIMKELQEVLYKDAWKHYGQLKKNLFRWKHYRVIDFQKESFF